MKILVVTHTTDLSGANKSLLSIIENLKNKIEFSVLVNSVNGDLVNELKKNEIKIIDTKYEWWYAKKRSQLYKNIIHYAVDISKYYSHRKIDKKILSKIENEKFDIIYTNTSTVEFGAIIARKLGIPHIWHMREFGKEDFNFIPLVNKEYMKEKLNEANSIIVISEALKKKYSQFVNEEKIKVVYNGFNISKLTVEPRQHDLSNEINILIAGQVCEAKGQNQAIEATNKLREKGLNIKLYIAGDIDKSYINKGLHKCNDTSYIEQLGMVKDMKKLRDKMDIELVCSKNEAFGRVTLEAMLHSIPVIGSNAGGTLELIDNEKTGLLYNYGDVNDLANKIEKLINDKELYESITRNAFKFAKRFTIDRTTNEIYTIFKNID